MTERAEQILEYVVLLYTETAEPVSSQQILYVYNLPYSSATIRNELAHLESEEYLTHVHTSSGRVPTDLGYRHYVNRLKGREDILQQYARATYQLLHDLQTMAEVHMKLRTLLLSMATESGNVAFGKLSSDIVLEEGLEKFLTHPSFSSTEFIRNALSDLDEVKQHIDDMSQGLTSGRYELYIGEENPLEHLHRYSVIVGRCQIDGDDGTIILIGPKSMQYAKNIALVEYVLNPENYDESEQ
jgi:transcriptional regulator of heat shock response